MGTIHRLPQPVVAKVEGMATAAGCQLVAAYDLRRRRACPFRHPRSQDRPPLFDSDGAVVARNRPQACPGDVAHRPADNAETALDWAWVNRVVPAGELEHELGAIVGTIVASSPLTVRLGKEAFHAQIELDERRAYDLTKAVMAMNARADDAQEGMCAFLEKRPATWGRR